MLAPNLAPNLAEQVIQAQTHSSLRSEASRAIFFVNTWIAQFPGKFPTQENIVSLAKLTELSTQAVEDAFGQVLQGGNIRSSSQAKTSSVAKEVKILLTITVSGDNEAEEVP
jgi:hypothetical protein